MTRLSLIILILAHLTGPPMAWCPGEDRYRVEMLEDRIEELLPWKLKGIREGWKRTVEGAFWR